MQGGFLLPTFATQIFLWMALTIGDIRILLWGENRTTETILDWAQGAQALAGKNERKGRNAVSCGREQK